MKRLHWGVGRGAQTRGDGATRNHRKLAMGFGGSQTSEFRIVDRGDFHPLLGPLPCLI